MNSTRAEVKQHVRRLPKEPVQIHLKRLGLFTCHNPPAAGDDRHIANTPTLQGERHNPPRGCG